MTQPNNEENKEFSNEEPAVTGEKETIHVDSESEIKSQDEEGSKELDENESAPEKDWAAELKAVEDKYLRLYAEFENYKRRTSSERIELFKTANQEVLAAIIPVLDDFDRAIKAMQTTTELASVKEGIELVNSKFRNVLGSKGLKPMESIGKDFDSDYHEAITKIPAPSDELKGKVIDEVEKGYFLGDKVIRFAKVVVGE